MCLDDDCGLHPMAACRWSGIRIKIHSAGCQNATTTSRVSTGSYQQLEEYVMKKQLCTIALSGLFAIGIPAISASAQDAPPPQGDSMQQQGGGGHHGMNADDQLAHMTKRYKLTADQQSQIKPILEAQQQSMMQMHSDTSMSRQDKMAKMQSMREDNKSKIEAVLTDDQKQKFEADQAKMQQRRQDHMGGGNMGGNGDSAPPPPPQ